MVDDSPAFNIKDEKSYQSLVQSDRVRMVLVSCKSPHRTKLRRDRSQSPSKESRRRERSRSRDKLPNRIRGISPVRTKYTEGMIISSPLSTSALVRQPLPLLCVATASVFDELKAKQQKVEQLQKQFVDAQTELSKTERKAYLSAYDDRLVTLGLKDTVITMKEKLTVVMRTIKPRDDRKVSKAQRKEYERELVLEKNTALCMHCRCEKDGFVLHILPEYTLSGLYMGFVWGKLCNVDPTQYDEPNVSAFFLLFLSLFADLALFVSDHFV